MRCGTSDPDLSHLEGWNRAPITAELTLRSSAVKLLSVGPVGHLPVENSQSTFRSKAHLLAYLHPTVEKCPASSHTDHHKRTGKKMYHLFSID